MTRSAIRAAKTAHETVNPNTKENYAMRIKNLVPVVMALVALTSIPACSEAPVGVHEPQGFGAEQRWPSICEDSNVDDADKPEFCDEQNMIEACYAIGDTNRDGEDEAFCETVEIGRLAGQLTATGTFAPPPLEAGQYVRVYLTYSGFTLANEDSLETCDGGSPPSEVTLLPKDGETADDVALCFRFKHDSGGGTGPGNTGSGNGDVCLTTDMPVDLSTCEVKVDGNVVTGDEDTDGVCPEGMFLDALPAKNTNFDVVCEDDELAGSINTGVEEDELTPVEVELKDTSGGPSEDPTALCLTIKVSNGDSVNLANCDVKDIAYSSNPLPTAVPPNGVCQGSDSLYFEGVKDGDRQYNVVCDEGNVLVPFTIEPNVLNDKDVFFAPAGTPGDPCYKDIGDHVDVYGMSLYMQAKLGHYDNSGTVCVLEPNLVDYEDFSITGMTDNGQCQNVGDPACLLHVAGTVNDPLISGSWYQHITIETTPADLMTLNPDEKRTHFVTLTDGNAKTVIVPVVVKNGVVYDE